MIAIIYDINKSIEELENDYWGDPDYNKVPNTSLVERVYTARKIPLVELKPQDLRILIGQNLSNNYTIPLALNILLKNPFIESEYYPGDLLKHVLDIELQYWIEHKEIYTYLAKIILKFQTSNKIISCSDNCLIDEIDEETINEINQSWKKISSALTSKGR